MIRTRDKKVTKDRVKVDQKAFNAYSLAGVGIGGVIGAGFFLGSGLAVRQAGPSVALSFLLGGLIMMQVLGAMTSINVNRLAHGSFRVYAEQMMGHYVGFLTGWVVFVSGILGMGSEALAMGVFVRYWLPHIPLPLLAIAFTLVVVVLNAFGNQNFARIELSMAAVKTLALIGFILIGGYALLTRGTNVSPMPFSGVHAFLPNGTAGVLQSMLIVIFAFSGIGAVAMASAEVGNPRRNIPRASVYMTAGIIVLYVLSMLVLVSLTPWNSVYTDKSPFVQAFDQVGSPWASSGLNIVILMAAFSVMAATYYTSIQMLVSLAEANEAPAFLKRSAANGIYRNAWLAVGAAAVGIVALSFIVPGKFFNYLVAASSYITFLNWSVNLLTYLIWRNRRDASETYESPLIWGRAGAFVTLAAIGWLFVMSLRVADFRMGFYAAAAIVAIVSLSYAAYSRLSMPPRTKKADENTL